jgi:hypothetical protein
MGQGRAEGVKIMTPGQRKALPLFIAAGIVAVVSIAIVLWTWLVTMADL